MAYERRDITSGHHYASFSMWPQAIVAYSTSILENAVAVVASVDVAITLSPVFFPYGPGTVPPNSLSASFLIHAGSRHSPDFPLFTVYMYACGYAETVFIFLATKILPCWCKSHKSLFVCAFGDNE